MCYYDDNHTGQVVPDCNGQPVDPSRAVVIRGELITSR